jgi:pimeloyl-ACP methyl ester carboxylesterase/DNA-binding CsgD family transcriptional regulator
LNAPQRIRFCIASDGARIAYAVAGQGPPLMVVNGWLSHLERDTESPIWGHWYRELARDHTLVRYDSRGFGLSDRGVADHSPEAQVRDLEAVADSAGFAAFAILAVTGGMAAAQLYACRHPGRVSRVLMHAPSVRGLLKRGQSPEEREVAATLLRQIELTWDWDDSMARQIFCVSFLPDASPEIHARFDELARQSANAGDAARRAAVKYNIDLSDVAPQVACPTLVTQPEQSTSPSFEAGREMASLIPGARLVPLRSRNVLLLEHEPAWPRFLAEARGFLRKSAAAAGNLGLLSPREMELLLLMARGMDNAQIAARLGISEKTVRNHITSVFAKLEVESRAQAIVLAHRTLGIED